MIDVIKQTPSIYSKQSRDYQVVARLYSALFNVSKMYIDDMNIWNNDIDNKLTMLRAKTLNLDVNHLWDLNDLEAITSCFKYLIKNKGTKRAFEYCINILMKIKKIKRSNVNIDAVVIENNFITFRIEENLLSLGIVEDLVNYLMPAGMLYRIISYKAINLEGILANEVLIETNRNNVSFSKVDLDDKIFIGDDNSDDKIITNTFVYDDSIS